MTRGMEKQKRVLLITSWFPADVGRRSLFNELADALAATGAIVDVIAVDWREVDRRRVSTETHSGERQNIYRFNPLEIVTLGRTVGLAVKWLGTSIKASLTTFKLIRRNHYDVIVSHAPSAVWAPILVCSAFSSTKKYLIQWDFTPYHQRAIGMMSRKITFNILLILENFLIRKFDTVGCMSTLNVDFLKRNYKLKNNQAVEILPIWGEANFQKRSTKLEARRRFNLPFKCTIAVFGGTLSKGRGTEDIIEAAKIAEQRGSNVLFLIVGSGPIEHEVKAASQGLTKVQVMDALPRKIYQELLGGCDCGIIATERDSGMPTFPSKTMDYFRAGIAIVASVEDTTDYGEFLERERAGLHVPAGDQKALLDAVENIGKDKKLNALCVKNGKRLMTDYFNVNNISHRLLET
jgi:glycosyltransferase involved in cell wall biosynthesis